MIGPVIKGVGNFIVLLVIFVSSFGVQYGYCSLRNDQKSPNALFIGDSVKDFQDSCTPKAEKTCILSAPADFTRLRHVKQFANEQINFFFDPLLTWLTIATVIIIFILMVHLTIVGHLDWRTLPIIHLKYDVEMHEQHQITYYQYMWMKYLVLRGNHPAVKKKDHSNLIWYRYKQEYEKFDYTAINTFRFAFLERKMLNKHLVEDDDNQERQEQDTTIDYLHGGFKQDLVSRE